MLLAEQFINADLDALKSYERKEGVAAEKELAFNEKREAAKEMLSDGVSVNKIHKYLKLQWKPLQNYKKSLTEKTLTNVMIPGMKMRLPMNILY